jgi:hypothetical protein
VKKMTYPVHWYPGLVAAAIMLVMLLSISGCRSEAEASLPPITPWQGGQISADAFKLAIIEPDTDGITLNSVSMAQDGGWISVNFKGPAMLVQSWNQGKVFVIDEATGKSYSQIPVAPVIGPLFGKPRGDNQPAYVMLVNSDNGVKAGSVLTVVLGDYKRLHVKVLP